MVKNLLALGLVALAATLATSTGAEAYWHHWRHWHHFHVFHHYHVWRHLHRWHHWH